MTNKFLTNKILKNVKIEFETWKKLQELKLNKEFKNMTEVIDYLLKYKNEKRD